MKESQRCTTICLCMLLFRLTAWMKQERKTFFRSWTSFDFKSYEIIQRSHCGVTLPPSAKEFDSSSGCCLQDAYDSDDFMWEVNTRQQADRVLLHLSDLQSGCSPAAFACCNSALTLKTKTNGYLLLLDTWSKKRANEGTAPGLIPQADWFRHCFQTKPSWLASASRDDTAEETRDRIMRINFGGKHSNSRTVFDWVFISMMLMYVKTSLWVF